jgi:hypothetical protein
VLPSAITTTVNQITNVTVNAMAVPAMCSIRKA